MSWFTIIRQIFAFEFEVSRLRSRRNQTHGGAQAADSDSETLSETTWHAGQELRERAEEVERVDPRVQITGSKRDEWIEGTSVEVRR